MTVDLSGRAVLVTGGARGVGRGITEAFLAAGADVVICGRTTPDVDVSRDGRTAVFVTADVRDPEQAAAAVDAVQAKLGRVDVVVNNAGGSPHSDAATASPRFAEKIVALNLLAPYYVAQRANALMQQHDGGCILNISSVSGVRPSPGTAVYGAAKAGVAHLTRSLAMEWAPKVRVNCVTVGLVRTERARETYGDEDAIAAIEATVPMRRLASPADVGAACLYLASPLAAYVTGAELAVHGGGEPPVYLAVTPPSGG